MCMGPHAVRMSSGRMSCPVSAEGGVSAAILILPMQAVQCVPLCFTCCCHLLQRLAGC